MFAGVCSAAPAQTVARRRRDLLPTAEVRRVSTDPPRKAPLANASHAPPALPFPRQRTRLRRAHTRAWSAEKRRQGRRASELVHALHRRMATKKAVHIESIRDLANTADDRRGQIAVASDAEADRWSAQKAFEETGDEGVLPQIMVNGQMKKVSKRDSNKWNDKGTGAMDDATFAKHDEEMCECSTCLASLSSAHPRPSLLGGLSAPNSVRAPRSLRQLLEEGVAAGNGRRPCAAPGHLRVLEYLLRGRGQQPRERLGPVSHTAFPTIP